MSITTGDVFMVMSITVYGRSGCNSFTSICFNTPFRSCSIKDVQIRKCVYIMFCILVICERLLSDLETKLVDVQIFNQSRMKNKLTGTTSEIPI